MPGIELSSPSSYQGATVRFAEAELPRYVADMVTTVCELTGLVAILKLGDVLAPAATRTDAGGVATEGLELDNKMVKPPTGAGAFSVTLPPTVLPPITPV